jgi:hypothetical protein
VVTASNNVLGDGSAIVFDTVAGAQLARLDRDGQVSAVAFSPDGTKVRHRQ